MSCPRPGEKCYEFMCGSSIDGVCTEYNTDEGLNWSKIEVAIYNSVKELYSKHGVEPKANMISEDVASIIAFYATQKFHLNVYGVSELMGLTVVKVAGKQVLKAIIM